MNRTIPTIGLAALFAIGCGSTLPSSRVAATETAVQSARAAGADRVAGANTHLKLAEDELAEAKRLNGEREGSKAEAMLNRADSDAELAAALSDEAGRKETMQPEPQQAPTRAKQAPSPK
jgi:hypothetical protein